MMWAVAPIGDNDDLVSVAIPDAALADSNDNELSATEDYSPVDSDQDDYGCGEQFSSTNTLKAFHADHGPFIYMSNEIAATEYVQLTYK